MSGFPDTGKTLIAMSGEPSVLRGAMELALTWEQYVDDAHDSITGAARTAAQKAAEGHGGEWAQVGHHIGSWVNKDDELVVGLPSGHPHSDTVHDLEYGGADGSSPAPALRTAVLHNSDGLARVSSKDLQWP